jgi:hypothetical protein
MDALSISGYENLHFHAVLDLAGIIFVVVPGWPADKGRRSVNNAECLWMIRKSNIASDIDLPFWEELF